MSHSTNALENKQQKHPKVNSSQYLYNTAEPRDIVSRDSPSGLETELIENSYIMKRHLRHNARRMRKYHSY